MNPTSRVFRAGDPHGRPDGELIAIVHSRRERGSALAAALEAGGYRVITAPLARSITDELAARAVDVVVIDHASDDFNVNRLCGDIRRSLHVPVLVYTTRRRTSDEQWLVDIHREGASVVVSAEASTARIVAQLREILRLSPRPVPELHQVTVGDVTIDLDGHFVFIDGKSVPCPPLLLNLLSVLAETPNHVISTQSLLVRVWGLDPSSQVQRVRVAVSLLRKLLGDGPRRPRIESVTSVGYRLTLAV